MAFAAISCGVYGYPNDLAVDVAIDTVRSTPTSVERVTFVCFHEANHALYRAELGDASLAERRSSGSNSF